MTWRAKLDCEFSSILNTYFVLFWTVMNTTFSSDILNISVDHQNLIKKYPAWRTAWRDYTNLFPSFAGIKSETKHQLMQRIRIKSYKMNWRILHFTNNFISRDIYLFHGRQILWWLWEMVANIVMYYKQLQTIEIVALTILKGVSKQKKMEIL